MKRFAAVLVLPVFLNCWSAEVPSAGAAPEATRGTPVAAETRPASLQPLEPEHRVSRSRRNLFAYETRLVAVVAAPVAVETVAPVIAAVAPPAVVETPAPQPPHFPYRYIGRFGPRHDPIAAFAGDGKIVTVRPGEKIDEQFVLRTIGLESVEIEARGWNQPIPIPSD